MNVGSHKYRWKSVTPDELRKNTPTFAELWIKILVLIGPLSVIQPFSHPLTFNFPWSLGYIRKLAFGSRWGNYLDNRYCGCFTGKGLWIMAGISVKYRAVVWSFKNLFHILSLKAFTLKFWWKVDQPNQNKERICRLGLLINFNLYKKTENDFQAILIYCRHNSKYYDRI